LIWPVFLQLFASKNISSQILFALLFHIDKILTVAEAGETEKTIYPFFHKCLLCGNLKIQKLAFARLPLIVDKVQAPETKRQLFLSLVGFLKTGKIDLILLDLKFLADNLDLFDREIACKQLFNELAEFFQATKEDNSQLFDLIFVIMERLYRFEDSKDRFVNEKFVHVFASLVCRATVSKEVFEEANALMQKILRANEGRKAVG
jgi:hypothetical protein